LIIAENKKVTRKRYLAEKRCTNSTPERGKESPERGKESPERGKERENKA